MLTSLWRNWRASRRSGPQLDSILANADPQAPLAERNLWLIDLARWLNRPGAAPAPQDGGDPRHARLRYVLQVLENNP
ncbi:MAG: site-specific recombinase, partial [Achromobacter mucicolens]